MANPNDINASILLEDKTSAVLKKVDDNTKKTADAITKEMGKTKNVFDKFNFSVNLTGLAMKGLKFVTQNNESAQDAMAITTEYLTNALIALGEALFALGTEKTAAITFKSVLDDMAKVNADEKIKKLNAQLIILSDLQQFAAGPLYGLLVDTPNAGAKGWKLIDEQIGASIKSLANAKKEAAAVQQLMAAGLTRSTAEGMVRGIITQTNKEAEKLPDHINDATKETFSLIEAQRLLKQETEEVEEAFRQTFGGGFRRETEAAAQQFQNLGAIGAKTASNMHGAFADNFFGAMRGEFRSMKDFGLSMMDALLAGFQRQIADFVASGILSFLGSAFSPGFAGIGSALGRNRGLPIFGGGGSDSPYGGGTGFIPSPSDLGGVGTSNISAPGNVYNVNINAVDAQSFEALAARNPRAIAAAVQAQLSSSPQFRTAVSRA